MLKDTARVMQIATIYGAIHSVAGGGGVHVHLSCGRAGRAHSI